MINIIEAQKYCKEDISKIENYDKAISDSTQTWDCHHRTETWWNCSKQDLIDNECYYHRKACELVFLTHAEHTKLHNKGKKHSAETRRKMSDSHKGKVISKETCKNMSKSHKGKSSPRKGVTLSDDTRRKISESLKGKKKKPFSEEHRKKISEAAKKRWKNKI